MADIKTQITIQMGVEGAPKVQKALEDIANTQIKLNKAALKDKGAKALKELKSELRQYGVSVKQVTGWERLRKQVLEGSSTAIRLLKKETRGQG